MKKIFVTTAMVMSMGCAFAQGNVAANDTVKTDTTKACPAKRSLEGPGRLHRQRLDGYGFGQDGCRRPDGHERHRGNRQRPKGTTGSTRGHERHRGDRHGKGTTGKGRSLVAMNDTVVTDTTKAQPAKAEALVAMVEAKDSTVQAKDSTATTPACDKKAGEKAIRALNAMRKITA